VLNRELASARSVSDWATEPRRHCVIVDGNVEGGAGQKAGGVGHFGGNGSATTSAMCRPGRARPSPGCSSTMCGVVRANEEVRTGAGPRHPSSTLLGSNLGDREHQPLLGQLGFGYLPPRLESVRQRWWVIGPLHHGPDGPTV
jgi:hypothetical protein